MNAPGPSAALTLAGALLGKGVALAATTPRGSHKVLPEEAPGLEGAVPKRRREFAAGRAAARLAMEVLGAPAMAIPMGADRAPVWPVGIVGSISHTDRACLAAVAWQSDVALLGLDLEPDAPLDPELWPIICTEAERDWLDGKSDPGRAAKLIFSAKESVYKAQYRKSRTLIDFHTLELFPDLDGGRFTARFLRDVAPFDAGTRVEGRFASGAGLVVTTVAVAA